jgi:hypothetical protein
MSDPVDEGGTDVATECAVEVRMNVMRLGVLDVALTPPADGTPGPTTDGFSVRLRPIADAYVVLTTTSFSGNEVYLTLLQGGLKGRTNAAGHVIGALDRDWHDAAPSIEVTEQDDRIRSWSAEPPVCDEFVWPVDLLLDREASLFWTYDREVFETVLRELWLPGNPGVFAGDDDPPEPTDAERAASHATALEHWGFIRLAYVERFPAPPLQIPTLSATDNMTIAELLLTPQSSGYIAPPPSDSDVQAHVAREAQAFEHSPLGSPQHYATYRHSGVIFDVTPPALRTLYAAEWAQRCAVHLRKSTAEDWAVLHRAREVVNAYLEGDVIHERHNVLLQSFLVSSNPGLPTSVAMPRPSSTVPQSPNPENVAVAEAFRVYAWRCVSKGVDRTGFSEAIEVVPGQDAWMVRAHALTIIHPLLSGPLAHLAQHLTLSSQTRSALLDYFDIYSFGRSLHQDGFHARFDANVAGIGDATGWVEARCASLLERAPLPSFVIAVGAQTKLVPEDRKHLYERYWDVNTAARLPFWTREISFEEWHALEPVLKWARGAASRGASVWKKFFEDNIKRYEFSLSQVHSANALLNTAYRFSVVTEGVDVVRNDHWTITTGRLSGDQHFRVDFDQRTISVHSYGTTNTSIPLTFRMIERVEEATFRDQPPMRQRVNRFFVDVPCSREHLEHNPHIPAWLKASANLLNAAFVLEKASREAQALDGVMCIEITQGVLGVVDGVDAIYQAQRIAQGIAAEHSALRRIEALGSAVTRAAKLNTILGIGMDFYAGQQILSGADEGTMNALRAGDAATWTMYEVKGVLKLASAGLASAGLAAPAAASLGLISSASAGAFVSGPVGWGLIVMGVIVLLADGAIVYSDSQQSHIRPFEAAVLAAISREFREDVGLEAWAPGDDRSRGLPCLTKVHLATLHDRLGRA